jgi:polyhydroxyalkanoate depolymerase
MYDLYQAQCDLAAPLQLTAKFMAAAWAPFTNNASNLMARHAEATCEMIARSGLRHVRPAFGIDSVKIGGTTVAVHEEKKVTSPFATLIHFRKDIAERGPVVILVAALSGHFSTLTRGTVQTLLQDHDVYITDWHSARDMPVAAGKFGLDEYIDHVIEYLEYLGPNTNVVAICQSGPPVLAAVSIMAQRESPNQPRSMTLMASPIDARISPTKINELAESKNIDFFRQLIQTVPSRYQGGGRKVYPGFIQLTAFMSMNVQNHVNKHIDLYNAMVDKDEKKIHTITEFYDEYRSVLDSTEEFYLETIQRVFLDYDLARGQSYHHGERVTPCAIRGTHTLVIEGEHDDMCGIGQTSAAFDLCTSLRSDQKQYHLQRGVGHYGVFNGSRWNSEIYPVIKAMIAANDARIAAQLAAGRILKIAA